MEIRIKERGYIHARLGGRHRPFRIFDKNFYAVDRKGKKKWEIALEDDGIRSTLIGSDGTIFVGMAERLVAISLEGKIQWEFRTGARRT